jgi:hypothetical protein
VKLFTFAKPQVFFVTTAVAFGLMTPYGGGRHVIYITDPYMLQVVSVNL